MEGSDEEESRLPERLKPISPNFNVQEEDLPAKVTITKVPPNESKTTGVLNCSIYSPAELPKINQKLLIKNGHCSPIPFEEEEEDAQRQVMQILDSLGYAEQMPLETEDLEQSDVHFQQVTYLSRAAHQLLDYFNQHEIFEPCLKTEDTKPKDSFSKLKVCPECGYKTHKSSNFERHMRTHTIKNELKHLSYDLVGPNRLQCQDCLKYFKDFWSLTAHMCLTKETNIQIHSCKQCGYKSSRKGNLELHMRSHQKEQSARVCDLCGFTCIDSNTFSTHMQIHAIQSPEKMIHLGPFTCSTCGSQFKHRKHLRDHERGHAETDEDNIFSCSLCDYKCNKKGNLKLHSRIHSLNKKYKCHLCEYDCNFKSCLDAHMRRHTGERPFKCSICDKAFRQKKHLIVHEKNHEKAV